MRRRKEEIRRRKEEFQKERGRRKERRKVSQKNFVVSFSSN